MNTAHAAEAEARDLVWEACYNARDLGGLPLAGGGRTRRGALIRSDMLHRLTPAGRRAVWAYGVRTIVDLRGPQEVHAEPSAFPDAAGAPLYRHLPIEEYEPHVGMLIQQAATREEVYCIILDHYPAAVAAILRAVAGAEQGGVVIHCHAGKDRTGIVVALLLRLAGVPDDWIVADYAASEPRLMPLYERIVAEAGAEQPWLKPLADPQSMRVMLAHLDSVHGGVPAYLRAAGLADADLQRLRARLRDA